MKILPYFKEDEGFKCSLSISLVENVYVLREADARIVSEYMESCVVIDEWMSNIKDPLTNRMSIPSKTWSDGMYVWDSSHIYYVKNYRARLPDEFICHVKNMISQGFNADFLKKEELREKFEVVLRKLIEGDESFYVRYE